MRPLGRKSKTAGRGSSESEAPLDIEAVLLYYGFNNMPSGDGWRKLKCHFHGERSASATVNLELGAYKCFVCDMTGDVIKIIQLSEEKEGRPGDYHSACKVYEGITGNSATGVRESTGRFTGRAVAAESRDYEEGDGFLRSRLCRHPSQR